MASSYPAASAPRSVFRRRIADPVVGLLKQGATPKRIALSMAFGAVIGIFPILGTTTAICFVLAVVFRLNIAAIQILNYAVYPLQIALVIPFIRFGERLFGAPSLPLSLNELVGLFQVGLLHAISAVWRSLMYAGAAWAIVAPLAVGAIYLLLLPMVRRSAAGYTAARQRSAAR